MDIIKILQKHLKKYKKVLELGSKKGDELEILDGYYEVVASEDKKTKTSYLKDKYLDIRVILLDPILVDTHKRFNCIYSKNLLDDFSMEQISNSFENQKNVLEEEGIIFHIFDKEKVSKNEIVKLISSNYEILELELIDKNFYIIAKLINK